MYRCSECNTLDRFRHAADCPNNPDKRYPASTFSLTISLDNDAMQTPENLASALTRIAYAMQNNTAGAPFKPITMGRDTRIAGSVRDENGNTVGSWSVTL